MEISKPDKGNAVVLINNVDYYQSLEHSFKVLARIVTSTFQYKTTKKRLVLRQKNGEYKMNLSHRTEFSQ